MATGRTNGEEEAGVTKVGVEPGAGDSGLDGSREVSVGHVDDGVHARHVHTHTTLGEEGAELAPALAPPPTLAHLYGSHAPLQSRTRAKGDQGQPLTQAHPHHLTGLQDKGGSSRAIAVGVASYLLCRGGEDNQVGREAAVVAFVTTMLLAHGLRGGHAPRPHNTLQALPTSVCEGTTPTTRALKVPSMHI